MHQNLKLKVLTTLVLHLQRRSQSLLAQCDTIYQTKLILPRLAEVIAQHRVRQTEIQRDRVVTLFAVPPQRLRPGLAQKFPARVPGKAVLRQRGRGMVLRRRAEVLAFAFLVSFACCIVVVGWKHNIQERQPESHHGWAWNHPNELCRSKKAAPVHWQASRKSLSPRTGALRRIHRWAKWPRWCSRAEKR